MATSSNGISLSSQKINGTECHFSSDQATACCYVAASDSTVLIGVFVRLANSCIDSGWRWEIVLLLFSSWKNLLQQMDYCWQFKQLHEQARKAMPWSTQRYFLFNVITESRVFILEAFRLTLFKRIRQK